MRAWSVLLLASALVASACVSEPVELSEAVPTESTTATTTATTTTTTRVAETTRPPTPTQPTTTTTLPCRDYVIAFEDIFGDVADAVEPAVTALLAAGSSMTFDDAAVVFTRTSSSLRSLGNRLRSLGSPPAHLASAVSAEGRLLSTLTTAYSDLARASRNLDADLADSAGARLDAAVPLAFQAVQYDSCP